MTIDCGTCSHRQTPSLRRLCRHLHRRAGARRGRGDRRGRVQRPPAPAVGRSGARAPPRRPRAAPGRSRLTPEAGAGVGDAAGSGERFGSVLAGWRGGCHRPRHRWTRPMVRFDRRRARRHRAGPPGSGASGWPRPRSSSRPARCSTSARRAGLAGDMQFTYRNPDRSTDPPRSCPRPARSWSAPWAYGQWQGPDERAARRAGGGAPGAGGPLRLARPLRRPPGSGARGDGRAAPGRRPQGGGGGRHQRPGRPQRGLVGRARLVRQERQPAPARCRELVRARRGGHQRRADTDRPAAGRRLRPLHPLPRRLPDRGHRRPGVVDATRCLAWLVQADGMVPPGLAGGPR